MKTKVVTPVGRIKTQHGDRYYLIRPVDHELKSKRLKAWIVAPDSTDEPIVVIPFERILIVNHSLCVTEIFLHKFEIEVLEGDK